MRLYHPLVLEVVSSILQEAAEEKQAVQGYIVAHVVPFKGYTHSHAATFPGS